MSRLDYNLHSRILMGLAEVLADARAKTSSDEVERLIARCPTIPLPSTEEIVIYTRDDIPHLGVMTRRSQQTLTALVKFAIRAPEEQRRQLIPRLLAYMQYLPAFEWEEAPLTKDPIPADLITFGLVSGLLELGYTCSEMYSKITSTLWSYAERLLGLMASEDVHYTITFILPSITGLSRALQLSPYLCRPEQLLSICRNTQPLIKDKSLEDIRHAITTCLKEYDPSSYSRRLLAKYWQDGVPLSSNRIVYDLLVVLRNVTARVIANTKPSAHSKVSALSLADLQKLHLTHNIEESWSVLMKQTAITMQSRKNEHVEEYQALVKALRSIYVMSLAYFEDTLKYAEKREGEGKKWASDAYMHEIMGSSLQVAALASVYLHEVDDVLVDHISECLFGAPRMQDARTYVASLDAAALLAINFHHLSNNMINMICRFLVTPSPVFDLYTETKGELLSIQQFAITRLAQCVQTKAKAQINPAATSIIYALLNEITRYSEDGPPDRRSYHENHVLDSPAATEQLSENQKQQLYVNALSAIVGVAVHLKDDAIIAQAYSVLVVRRKCFPPAAIASLMTNFVDLALVSSSSVFQDIITIFSVINRESLTVDNKQPFTAVMDAQLQLAKRISTRPELYSLYLTNLLNLFVDNGNTVQRMSNNSKKDPEISLASKLGQLLPVLRALLSHDDFQPHLDASEETVSLFRNLWFHCILFGFVTESMWLREWHDSLQVIAKKTPVLVIESATNYLESDLEYNSVLRSGNTTDQSLTAMRQKLTTVLPSLAYDIKSFSFAQVVFALSVYHIEMMRSRMGDCNYILHYFMNDGVNNSVLTHCLETITDKVVAVYTKDAMFKARNQNLEDELRCQMTSLLKLCCHRLAKVHQLAIKTTDHIVSTFPQVLAEKSLITLLLELVQLLWLSCESEYRDEYCPVFHFKSVKIDFTLEIGDTFSYRKELCTKFYQSAKKWLGLAMDRAPMEVNGLLQDYMADFDRFAPGQTLDSAHLGRSLALDIGRTASRNQLGVDFVPKVPSVQPDESSDFVNGFTTRRYHVGEISGIEYVAGMQHGFDKIPDNRTGSGLSEQAPFVLGMLESLFDDVKRKHHVSTERLRQAMLRTAAFIVSLKKVHPDLVSYLVKIPVYIFSPESLIIGTDVWNWVIVERPDIEKRLMVEMLSMWSWAQRHRKGLYSPMLNTKHPFLTRMTYTPSEKSTREKTNRAIHVLFSPHITWIKFLTSRFYAIRHRSRYLVNMFIRLLQESFQNASLMSTHPLARQPLFQLLFLGLKVLQSTRMEALAEYKFRTLVYDAAFNWFSLAPRWHYGSRKSLALMEHKVLMDFYNVVVNDTPKLSYLTTSSTSRKSNSKIASGLYMFLNDKTKDDVIKQHQQAKKLLLLFLDSELSRLSVWCNPLNAVGPGYPSNFAGNTEKTFATDESWKDIVRFAWEMSPRLAVQMASRFVQPVVQRELHRLIANNMLDVVDVPEALVILLGDRLLPNAKLDLKFLKYWAPVPAITAANYFSPAYGKHPLILQYAMRSLEYYPVDIVFFYVPQIVQALRHDEAGYVQKYIMEAGQVSQLFAHQIIWNMQANFYIDADKECNKPDQLKPTLETIIDNLVNSFTGDDRDFYEREFKFFGDVTAISGYLKEYIKYGQNEKKPLQKKRLDEELAKIKVDVGVYLPSNPDGHVIDINRSSGKPLQSHAKAPFMATFKIEKKKEDTDPMSKELQLANQDEEEEQEETVEIWQGAIFKVGDDCRQDVLALQLIAVFKNIFTSIGLDLYVYPYRVVATAPGRGVIDVIPRSISRDQLGREKVNSLYDYFVAKYGGPDSIYFQRARMNFVQSLAAYSVISYLLQIKDRHNGNIMLDDDGHLVHIDFGFIFDIAPGGITFESSPFKLTAEMVQVMGGNSEQQSFRQFSELVIKAYLASRPYAEVIMQLVTLMLQSSLPCFKGDTIRRMRTRFQTDKSERAAADFMIQRIKESFENQRTVLYDYFQKLTNGIPY